MYEHKCYDITALTARFCITQHSITGCVNVHTSTHIFTTRGSMYSIEQSWRRMLNKYKIRVLRNSSKYTIFKKMKAADDRHTIDRISPTCNQHLQQSIGELCSHNLIQNHHNFTACMCVCTRTHTHTDTHSSEHVSLLMCMRFLHGTSY